VDVLRLKKVVMVIVNETWSGSDALLGEQRCVTDTLSTEHKKAQLTQGQRRHSRMAAVPRWPSAAILNIIEPEIAQFDPPTPKTLA